MFVLGFPRSGTTLLDVVLDSHPAIRTLEEKNTIVPAIEALDRMEGGYPQSVAGLDQAYAQLGLTSKASDAEIKRAYRKLVSQYHPDKLVSHGLPEEMMEVAKNRVRDINTAYDRIKQARGFK